MKKKLKLWILDFSEFNSNNDNYIPPAAIYIYIVGEHTHCLFPSAKLII
jgi:hypothetical protein